MNWWNKISKIGCEQNMDLDDFRRLHLANRFIFIALLISILFMPLVLDMNNSIQTATHIAAILLTPFAWLFSKRQLIDQATIYMCTLTIINIVVQGLVQHYGSPHYLLFPIAILPLVLMKKTSNAIVIFVIAVLGFIISEEFHSFVSIATDYSIQKLESVHTITIVVSLFSTFIVLYQTKITSKVYQKQIIKQAKEIEERHKEITDSINYAERIQYCLLASKEELRNNLTDYFIFFQPKDVVSGDFYWAGKLNNGNFALVNADSTGHGVAGAIMSILNISSIEKAVEKGLTNPAEIFNDTRKTIINYLKKDGSEDGGKDGMDACLMSFNKEKTKMSYAAAQNPIWIIRAGKLTEIKPEKMPIGKQENDHKPFVGGEYDIQKGDLIYTITDGFKDQFGGPKGKKFMVKKMRQHILSIANLSMLEQHQNLIETFNKWKGEIEQIDDVCVIGVRI